MSLKTIRLGFKAFDPHELLCHFLAEGAGYYRDAGLQVELSDITFTPDSNLPSDMFQASCGAAFLAGLQGTSQKILFVAVNHPMFWLYGPHDIAALEGGRIATFPAIAPPWHFTRILLQQHGLNPDKNTALIPARDDTARLGLLRSGHVEAAVLSSAVAPGRVEQLGYRQIAGLGDAIRIPTTGLAVNASMIEKDPGLVRALVEVHLLGLQRLHHDAEATQAVLEDVFYIETPGTMERYKACFTPDGRMDSADGDRAIELMSNALGLTGTPHWQMLYDPSFLS